MKSKYCSFGSQGKCIGYHLTGKLKISYFVLNYFTPFSRLRILQQ